LGTGRVERAHPVGIGPALGAEVDARRGALGHAPLDDLRCADADAAPGVPDAGPCAHPSPAPPAPALPRTTPRDHHLRGRTTAVARGPPGRPAPVARSGGSRNASTSSS